MNRILIIEDEEEIAGLLRETLCGAGYRCDCACDGFEGADRLEGQRYDLVLLDILLPRADGFELMEYIRPLGIPVIFLTARSSVEDKVRGLHMGAEDYITKPFAIAELLARVETVLRRCGKLDRCIEVCGITVDTAARQVRRAGQPVALTLKEYELLLLFFQNRGITLYREDLWERVWGGGWMGESRTVDLHVQRLRKKLGLEGRLVPVYKIGYRLEV